MAQATQKRGEGLTSNQGASAFRCEIPERMTVADIYALLIVPEVSPPLAALHTLLDGLNVSRDLFAFLRRIQQAFATSLEVT